MRYLGVFSAPRAPFYLIETMKESLSPVARDHEVGWYAGGSVASGGVELRLCHVKGGGKISAVWADPVS